MPSAQRPDVVPFRTPNADAYAVPMVTRYRGLLVPSRPVFRRALPGETPTLPPSDTGWVLTSADESVARRAGES